MTDEAEGGVTEPVPAPRPRWRHRLIVTASVVVAAGALAGGFWGWSAASESRFDEASASLATQQAAETSAVHAYDARLRDVSLVSQRIRSVVDSPAFVGQGATEAATLSQALGVLEPLAAAQPVEVPAAVHIDQSAYRPPWQLVTEAEQFEGRTRASQQTEGSLRTLASDAAAAETSVYAAETAYFGNAATAAEQTISSNALSNRSVQVPLLRLIEQARNSTLSESRNGAFVDSLANAEAQVVASQATQQSELDDPAWAVRREVEAYARSLSNGVALEFVWAPEVSGLGDNWLSGTAESYDSDGGWSIISLNYTVEREWENGRNARALVAHEVGHTQVYRCWPLFSGDAFHQNSEIWATAWSISQGFDVPGSGIEAYGRPTDEQISVAGQCR
ncbi:hypothetical protein [Subtercola vilae]|uniref:Uncharacterized protein n=1 Tax=Subtercola vilae TaxID=2056433 RepID=A0A4T2BYN7_9MICO|nr:hypothetical protein [Subtercola vilae]TIH37093.1 hypothetical protein D4765_08700 [Subtercola vilae]